MGNQQSCQLLPRLIPGLRLTWAPSGALSFRGVGDDMDSVRGVFRLGLWFGCLLCVLPIANATTVPVVVPSAHATVKNSSGVTVSGNSLRVTGPLQGTFIPADGPGSRVSLKVKPAVDFSVGRIINQVKPLVRKGFAPALGLAGVVWAINQLPGASFDPATGQPIITPAFKQTGTVWHLNHWSGGFAGAFPSFKAGCDAIRPHPPGGSTKVYDQSSSGNYCRIRDLFTGYYTDTYAVGYQVVLDCLHGYNSTTLSCNPSPITPVPFTEQDYAFVDSKLDAIVNPEWLRDILLTSCSGASNPENCADFLKDWQANIVGPATVPGSTTTTASTYVKPDGTVGTKGSTTTNNYKVTYGPTSFTFNKTSTTTYTQDGAVAGAECNTVIELKLEHHAA